MCFLICILTNTRYCPPLILQMGEICLIVSVFPWWILASFNMFINCFCELSVFCPFSNWIVFFLLNFRFSLFWIQILCKPPVIYVENIFSHSVACVFLCSFWFLVCHIFLSFNVVNFASLCDLCFYVLFKKSFPALRSQRCFLYLLLKI